MMAMAMANDGGDGCGVADGSDDYGRGDVDGSDDSDATSKDGGGDVGSYNLCAPLGASDSSVHGP